MWKHVITFGVFIFFLTPLVTCAQVPAQAKRLDVGAQYHPVKYNALFQDADGLIWLGTSKGLFSFDGWNYRHFPLADSLPEAPVSAIGPPVLGGALSVAFENGWVAELSDDTFVTLAKLGAKVTALVPRTGGGIWAATYGNGVFTLALQDNKPAVNVFSSPSQEVYAAVADALGRLWVGTDNGAFCLGSDGQWIHFGQDQGFDLIVTSLARNPQKGACAGFYDLGYRCVDAQGQPMEGPGTWAYGAVSAVAYQTDEFQWIGTEEHGLLRHSLHGFPSDEHFFESLGVASLLSDNEDNLWIALRNGELWLLPATFEWLSGPWDGKSIQSIGFENDKMYYASPKESNLSELKGQNLTSFLRHGPMLFVSTFGSGIFYKKGNAPFQKYDATKGLVNDNVLSLSGQELPDGTYEIWASTLGGVSRLMWRDGSIVGSKHFDNSNGFSSNYVYQSLKANDGNIWFATDGNGIVRFDGEHLQSIMQAAGVEFRSVYSMAIDGGGNLWFSTPDKGIFRYDGLNYKHYGLNEGLSSLAITSLCKDANGDIVIVNNDGVDVIEWEKTQVRAFREAFLANMEPDLNAVAHVPNSRQILLGTQRGVLRYMARSENASHESRTSLTRVSILLKPIDFKHRHLFSASESHFTFDYIGLWYADPAQVHYRHKLEGFDLNWIESKDHTAIYPQLPPGTYTFVVQSTIHESFDDAVSLTYTFTIQLPFWRSWWFLIMVTLLLAAAAIFWVRFREARLRRSERLQQERVMFELKMLQSQVNPHFLFNNFNTLIGLIEDDPKSAVGFAEHLSDYYRNILRYRESELISVDEELELVQNFCYLLKFRYGEHFKLHISLRPETRRKMVIPLSLQMLVENVVKHNNIQPGKPVEATIADAQQGDALTVSNTLSPKRSTEKSTGFGIESLNLRYKLMAGKEVVILKDQHQFSVTIPLLTVHHSS